MKDSIKMGQGATLAYRRKRRWAIVAMLGSLGGLTSCVQVTAPDKPIVIELNINIKQEVVYRLDSKAQELIQNQTEIF